MTEDPCPAGSQHGLIMSLIGALVALQHIVYDGTLTAVPAVRLHVQADFDNPRPRPEDSISIASCHDAEVQLEIEFAQPALQEQQALFVQKANSVGETDWPQALWTMPAEESNSTWGAMRVRSTALQGRLCPATTSLSECRWMLPGPTHIQRRGYLIVLVKKCMRCTHCVGVRPPTVLSNWCRRSASVHAVAHLQILWAWWRKIQKLYKQERLLHPGKDAQYPSSFFDKKWAGRGRDYRMAAEPVDIANRHAAPPPHALACAQNGWNCCRAPALIH